MIINFKDYFVRAPVFSFMRMDQLNVRMEEFDLSGVVEEIWLINDAVAAQLVLKEYSEFLSNQEVDMLFDVVFLNEAQE